MKKTILCYGDSNTYGYDPRDGLRYDETIRWTGRLAALLGEGYRVIEEGCNGRTTVFDDPEDPWKNGLPYLKPCLNTHKPVDAVVLMLGSNDLKTVFHASAQDIADGAGVLVETIISFCGEKQGYAPKIILVSPPEIGRGIKTSAFYGQFLEDAIIRSQEFSGLYRAVSNRYGCVFADAAEWIEPSEVDSLHLDPEAHRIMAEKLYAIVREEIGDAAVVSVEQMRRSDAYTIEHFTSGRELMRRAAQGVYDSYESWDGKQVAILVGGGNNGGDGYALAGILKQHAIAPVIYEVSEKRSDDGAYYYRIATNLGVEIFPYIPQETYFSSYDVIVDCILGTGFKGEVRGKAADAIRAINDADADIISVDINSGMDGDTGEGNLIVRSDMTVSIGFLKKGLVTENAKKHIGKLVNVDIGIRLVE